jgi:hypothetical protein
MLFKMIRMIIILVHVHGYLPFKKEKFRKLTSCLKGLSHEIFEPVYWPVWMHLGLNKNRVWFLNFKGAPSI